MILKKIFFKLMNNAVFGKTVKNEGKIEIEVVATKARRKYLLSEPNYHRTIFFLNICE